MAEDLHSRKSRTMSDKRQKFMQIAFLTLGMLLLPTLVTAGIRQKVKDTPLTIRTIQHLSFGAFYRTGTGGTITVSELGERRVTAGIYEANLGFAFFPAIFELTGEKGVTINILFGNDVTLKGSNGGSVRLHLDNASSGMSFKLGLKVAPPAKQVSEQISVGGTLTVGSLNSSPDGSYTGTFNVTFIQP